MARVLITGVGGQDGTLLAELARSRGDEVLGVARRAPSARVRAIADVRVLDIVDADALTALVAEARPDQVFHLAAEHTSSVGPPVDEARSLRVNVGATHALLAAVRAHAPACRVFLAGSCHIFGGGAEPPQDESTPMRPDNIYGVAKLAVLHLGRLFRERHGLRCGTGILFNHESPLRAPGYLSHTVAHGVLDIAERGGGELVLGDLDAALDWGHAADYVEAMTRMVALDDPDDLVIASGASHTVRELVELAFARVGLRWQDHVRVDPGRVRGDRRRGYRGNIARITARTGWRPTTTFEELVALLVDGAREVRRAGAPR